MSLNLDLNIDVQLPIHAYEEEITRTIRDNKCVVLTGSTGCGKVRYPQKLKCVSFFLSSIIFQTTQLPKFIIKDCLERKEEFNVLVSQPRKIAAITNATRVAQELHQDLGSLVGFQVSLHKKINQVGSRTKVLYCTTGVILQKLIRNKTMKMFTHIVLGNLN